MQKNELVAKTLLPGRDAQMAMKCADTQLGFEDIPMFQTIRRLHEDDFDVGVMWCSMSWPLFSGLMRWSVSFVIWLVAKEAPSAGTVL